MSEPRRWTLHGLTSRPYLEGRISVPERIDPPLEIDEVVEVMPVSEHEEYGARVMPVMLEVENLKMEIDELRGVAEATLNAWDLAYETIKRYPTLVAEVERLRSALYSALSRGNGRA